jgi:hypothetical protein
MEKNLNPTEEPMTEVTPKKRRGRPRKNVVIPEGKICAGPDNKVADIVKKQLKDAKEAVGRQLTIEEQTNALLTPKNMIDDNGIFMGEDYEKIIKKPHSEEEIEHMRNMYQYDPVKETHKIRIIFKVPLLGMSPGNQELMASHVAKMSMDAMTRDAEIMIAGAQQVIDKQREHFIVVNGRYMWATRCWMGFIRDKAQLISYDADSMTSDAANLKNNVLNRISFSRFMYPLTLPKRDSKLYTLDRSMPGDNYKRETSLKSSGMAPPGTTTYFVLQINNRSASGNEKKMSVRTWDVVRETLNYGAVKGTGGWRGSGLYGTFLWEELDDNGVVIDGNTLKEVGCTTNEPEFADMFYAYVDKLYSDVGEHAEPEMEEFAL